LKLTARERAVLLTPLALLLAGWLVGPALAGLVATFTDYSPFTTSVRWVGLANFAAVVRDPQFADAARNIAVFVLLAVPLELAVGFAIALLLRRPLRGRAAWRVVLLLPWLVSPIATGVMWHFLFGSANGILDFVLGWLGGPPVASPIGEPSAALPTMVAIDVWRVAPFVAFVILPALGAIPEERWEEARLAGASVWQQLWTVVVPGTRSVTLTVAMLLTGLALGTFDTTLILTGGGPGTATLTPALYSYGAAFGTNEWPVGAAAAWIIAGAVLVVALGYMRLATDET
jgi:multiple sugar transport system permease protein